LENSEVGAARIGKLTDDLRSTFRGGVETGDYGAVKPKAIKRVLAWQIKDAMREDSLIKAEVAKRMSSSRSQLDRRLAR